MTTQMRVEKGKTHDKARRKESAMTKDMWLVGMPEIIIEGQDEDDENVLNFAEQYEEWRGKYTIADEEDDEESGGDGKRSYTHIDWVENEIEDISR